MRHTDRQRRSLAPPLATDTHETLDATVTVIHELHAGDTHRAHAAMVSLRPAYADDLTAFVTQIDERQRPAGYRLFATFATDAADGASATNPAGAADSADTADAASGTSAANATGADPLPSGDVVAVAGFRPVSSLAWGEVLYLDDLSTHTDHRGKGHGSALLRAVEAEAKRLGCVAVHLDSGHHRYPAHRLYLGAGYEIRSHHFVKILDVPSN